MTAFGAASLVGRRADAISAEQAVRTPAGERDRATSVGLRWASLWALLGLGVTLLWVYGTFSNRLLRLCEPVLAGDRLVTACGPATSDPLALGLVVTFALIPAAAQVAITLLRRRS